MATQHYDSSLLLRVLRGWYRVIRIARAQRREQEEEEDRKRKMQSLLQAARVKAEGNLRWVVAIRSGVALDQLMVGVASDRLVVGVAGNDHFLVRV